MSFGSFLDRLRQLRAPATASLVVVEDVASTNQLAGRIVREYGSSATTVQPLDLIAWQQLAGRGRGDHDWSSPAGAGAYISMVRPVADPESLQRLPLSVSVGLCEALNRWLGGRCQLKWPNDLMVSGRKLGGILIDVLRDGSSQVAVIGFGVNHADALDALDAPEATSLGAEAAEYPPLAELVVQLIQAVDARLVDGGDLLEAYRHASLHRDGDSLRCRLLDEVVDGRFRGFDHRGFLRLETDTGTRLLPSGELGRGC